MAEALCGPSNPLQTFQKQTSLDRTLQQDRLAHKGHSQESFRTAPNHANPLDAQFAAFHNPSISQGPTLQMPSHDFGFDNQVNHRHQRFDNPPEQSSWVSEFNQLHLHNSQTFDFAPATQAFQPRYAASLGSYSAQPRHLFEISGNTNLAHQTVNHFPLAQPAPWQQPSVLPQTSANPTVHAKFDESAFQAAFDAAEDQSLEQRPGAPETRSQEQTIQPDRGQLALLQYNLFACVMVPTEQNVHKAALFLSLLEQYDPKTIGMAQTESLVSVLMYISDNPQGAAYFARYNLENRATNYLQSLPITSPYRSTDPAIEELRTELLGSYYACIMSHLDRSAPNQNAATNVATDLEMQADLAMQLRRLNNMPAQDRVLQAVSDSTVITSPNKDLQTALEKIWTNERNLLEQFPDELQKLDAQLGRMPPAVRHVLQPLSESIVTETVQPDGSIQNQNQRQQPEAQLAVQHDELAQTAADLLDKVSHDQSEKFQNSTFLDLMRKLKNREVQVEGDQMVAVCKPHIDNGPPARWREKHVRTDDVTQRDPHAEQTTQIQAKASVKEHQAAPLPNRNVHGASTDQTPPRPAEQAQPVDGQEVIDLLTTPTFDPHGTDPTESPAGWMYDQQDAELGASLFDE